MPTLPRTNRNWIFWIFIFSFFCLSVYALRSVLLPFVVGIIIGYLLDPLTSKFTKLGLNRTIATVLVLAIVVIILVPALGMLIGVIDEQLSRFINILPDYISSLLKKMEPILLEIKERFPSTDTDKLKSYLRSNMLSTLKLAGSVLQSIITSGFAFFNLLSLILITPIVTFYMLRDWNKFLAKVDNLLPRQSKKSIRQQAREIDRTLAGFLRGQFSVCVILGTYYSLGLYFVGLELGVLIGFIAGLISFIPYVGTITGFVLSLGIALVQFDSIIPVLSVIMVFVTGQFLEGNFLTPKLVGDSIGVHPVWIMFALLAGGALLGFLGLMIAVPVAGITGVLIKHAISNYKKSSLYLDD